MLRSVSVRVMLLAAAGLAGADCVWVSDRVDGTVTVIDDGRPTTVLQLGAGSIPVEMARNPSTPQLYVSDAGRASLWVIDVSTREIVMEVPLPIASPCGLAVTPNGTKVFVGNADGGVTGGQIAIVNTMALDAKHPIDVSSQGLVPIDLAMSMDGAWLYLACNETNNVLRYDIANATLVASGGFPSPLTAGAGRPFAIATLTDGSAFYVAEDDPSGAASCVDVVQTADGSVTCLPLAAGERAMDVYVHPRKPKVLVPTGAGGTVRVIDTEVRAYTYSLFFLPGGATPMKLSMDAAGYSGAVTDPAHGVTDLFTTFEYEVFDHVAATGSSPYGTATAPVVGSTRQSPKSKQCSTFTK